MEPIKPTTFAKEESDSEEWETLGGQMDEEEIKKDDSASDQDSSSGDDDDSEDIDYGAYDASDDEEEEDEVRRMTSKQVNEEYKYEIVPINKLYSEIKKRIIAVKSHFEYANLDDGFVLTHLRNNKFLVEQTCERLQELVLKMMSEETNPAATQNGELMCLIDYMPMEKHQGQDLGCGHSVCNECWVDYFNQKVKSGINSLIIKCPEDGCRRTVPIEMVQEMGTKKIKTLYSKLLTDDFVAVSPTTVFCLGKGCELAFKVEDKFLTKSNKLPSQDAVCSCGTLVCLRCEGAGHEPLDCKMFEEWDSNLQKVLDTLNNSWKKKNSKPCPHCKTDIEKNQGCMHMTCAKCRGEFCWLCLGNWRNHNRGSCNKYVPDKDKFSENYLKRLQFFVDRYIEHKRALEMNDNKIKEHIEMLHGEKLNDFSNLNKFITPGCLDFYLEALKFITKCRSFIVYTYPIGFKIMDENRNSLFSQTQYFLEYALEVLDKFLQDHPISHLMGKNETGVCVSKFYSKIKAKCKMLMVNLGVQFKNAKNEFGNPDYLMCVQLDFEERQREQKSK
jgi:ariadne-1